MKPLVRPRLCRLLSAALVAALVNPSPAAALRPVRAGAEEIAAGLEETPQSGDLAQYDLPPENQAPRFLSAKQALLSSSVERWLSNRIESPQMAHLRATLTLTARAPATVPDYAAAETRFTAAVAAWQRARTLVHQQRNTLRGQYRARRSRMPPADRQAFLAAVRYIAKALRRAEAGLAYATAHAPQLATTVPEIGAPAGGVLDPTTGPASPPPTAAPAFETQRPNFVVNQASGLWGWLQKVPPEKTPAAVTEIRMILSRLVEGASLDALRLERQVAEAYANGGAPSGTMLGWQWVEQRVQNAAVPRDPLDPPPSYTAPTSSALAVQIWQTEFLDPPPTLPAEFTAQFPSATSAVGLEEQQKTARVVEQVETTVRGAPAQIKVKFGSAPLAGQGVKRILDLRSPARSLRVQQPIRHVQRPATAAAVAGTLKKLNPVKSDVIVAEAALVPAVLAFFERQRTSPVDRPIVLGFSQGFWERTPAATAALGELVSVAKRPERGGWLLVDTLETDLQGALIIKTGA